MSHYRANTAKRAYMRTYMQSLRARWLRSGLTTAGTPPKPREFGVGHCRRCGLVQPDRTCLVCEREMAA